VSGSSDGKGGEAREGGSKSKKRSYKEMMEGKEI